MTKQKRAAAPQKAARTATQRPIPAPLALTLETKAAQLLRELAALWHFDPAAVAAGILVDEIPGILESIREGRPAEGNPADGRWGIAYAASREAAARRDDEFTAEMDRAKKEQLNPHLVTFARPAVLALPVGLSYRLGEMASDAGTSIEDVVLPMLENELDNCDEDSSVFLWHVDAARACRRKRENKGRRQ